MWRSNAVSPPRIEQPFTACEACTIGYFAKIFSARFPGGRVALCWPFWFPLIALEHQHVPRDRSAILELNSHGEIVAITIERDVDILERRGARSEQAGGRASCRDRGERNELAYRLGDVRFEAAAPGASKAAGSCGWPAPRESAAAALLRDTRFDELTLRDALDLIYRLKNLVAE